MRIANNKNVTTDSERVCQEEADAGHTVVTGPFLQQLLDIADAARKQCDGRYTTESDAVTALELIDRLARTLATNAESW